MIIKYRTSVELIWLTLRDQKISFDSNWKWGVAVLLCFIYGLYCLFCETEYWDAHWNWSHLWGKVQMFSWYLET